MHIFYAKQNMSYLGFIDLGKGSKDAEWKWHFCDDAKASKFLRGINPAKL